MVSLSIVIIGATGDLFKRKLISALFAIFCKGGLGNKFSIIGISRKFLSHVDFRKLARGVISQDAKFEEYGEVFLNNFFYYSLDAQDENSYLEIRKILDNNDSEFKECSNKLFYVATLPDLYEDIFLNIKKSGLSIPCAEDRRNNSAWARIIVEKPFGNDSKNAEKLDYILSESFQEDQIYRIDHYLAKETVQNILSFRFNNPMFLPVWSHKYIERVEIKAFETIDVSGRQNFYDKVGAVRDFGQNHLLEMLALIALEEPERLEDKYIREARAKVLRETSFDRSLVIGQYEGYRTPEFENSNTETYFKAKLKIENERWKGVPFFIEHGKALSSSRSEVSIYFKSNETSSPNAIHFNIQPNAEICVEMNVSDSSSGNNNLNKKNLCFPLAVSENQHIYPYQKLLLDAISGDQTLFVSSDEIKEEWRIAEEIQKEFEDSELKIYKKGIDPELI